MIVFPSWQRRPACDARISCRCCGRLFRFSRQFQLECNNVCTEAPESFVGADVSSDASLCAKHSYRLDGPKPKSTFIEISYTKLGTFRTHMMLTFQQFSTICDGM